MKKIPLKYLVSIVSLALIGALSIQIYWIFKAYDFKEKEFNTQVYIALKEVLEKNEKLELYRHLKTKDIALKTIDQKNNLGLNSIKRDTVIVKEGDNYHLKISEYKYAGPDSTITQTTTRTFSKKINEINYKESQSLSIPQDMMATFDSSEFIKQQFLKENAKFERKSELLNDLIQDLNDELNLLRVDERIDAKILDSLLQEGLLKYKLPKEFEWYIEDNESGMQYFTDKKINQLIHRGFYKVALFPNDLNHLKYNMNIRFPKRNRFILWRMVGILSISIVLFIIIVYAFFYSALQVYRVNQFNIMKNDFINNMTHELKTPISTISLACEALSDPDLSQIPSSRERYTKMINTENQRLSTLVESILRTALIDQGKLNLKKEVLDLKPIVEQVIENFELKVLKNRGTINLNYKVQNEYQVFGDRTHLSNVIYNLVDNAFKYSKEIVAIDIDLDIQDQMVTLSVKDRGEGIAEEHLPFIFQKLYRVPRGNLHDVKGFGIGLNYVKKIIELHQGKINVKSKLGQGSTFTVKIPKY